MSIFASDNVDPNWWTTNPTFSYDEVFAWLEQKRSQIQGGEGVEGRCDDFPKKWLGTAAEAMWHNEKFAYGMEYGYLLALHQFRNFLNKDGAVHAAWPTPEVIK